MKLGKRKDKNLFPETSWLTLRCCMVGFVEEYGNPVSELYHRIPYCVPTDWFEMGMVMVLLLEHGFGLFEGFKV